MEEQLGVTSTKEAQFLKELERKNTSIEGLQKELAEQAAKAKEYQRAVEAKQEENGRLSEQIINLNKNLEEVSNDLEVKNLSHLEEINIVKKMVSLLFEPPRQKTWRSRKEDLREKRMSSEKCCRLNRQRTKRIGR